VGVNGAVWIPDRITLMGFTVIYVGGHHKRQVSAAILEINTCPTLPLGQSVPYGRLFMPSLKYTLRTECSCYYNEKSHFPTICQEMYTLSSLRTHDVK
jgi:hypothetical protein